MILIMPDNIEQIKNNVKLYDGVILSLDKYSVNSRYTINIDELKTIMEIIPDKEVFISVNKNIENKELDDFEKVLLELNKYKIKGILYSDPCVISYKDKFNYELVWSQEHLVTNYETINYWKSFGVKYAYLSSDITVDEIKEISDNTDVLLMVNIFGYLPMFVSKRHIVDNYLKYFNIKDNSSIHYIKKEGKVYPIVDSNYTYAFTCNILNGVKDYYNMNAQYYICNGFLIENDIFSKILSIMSNISPDNVEECALQINDIFENIDDGFLHTSTVSKVKK